MSGKKKRRFARWLIVGLIVAFAACFADYQIYPALPVEAKSYDRNANGLWLRYTWYFGQHSLHDYELLSHRLASGHFKFAYFHVRSVDAKGDLKVWLPQQAKQLNETIAGLSPGVKRIAWVFIDRKTTSLSDLNVRKGLAATAGKLITEGGFQGVQWDYEICDNGDRNFLALLEETKRTIPSKALLCVAAPTWMPWPISSIGWSERYFAQVAKRCDQIAVMAYDTGFYMPRSYVWLVEQDTKRIPKTVANANPRCSVLLGLPTYIHGEKSHNPKAENLRMGLKGVKSGLDSGVSSAFQGVAIFADYTTTDQDWNTYQRLWASR